MTNIQEKNGKDYLEELRAKRTLETLRKTFERDEERGIKLKKWNVIPAKQYHNLLKNFMLNKEVPKSVVSEWFKAIIFPNIRDIEIFTKTYSCKELDYDNFVRWVRFPDRSMAWTDTKMKTLTELACQYNDGMSGSEMLVLLNMILDVSHGMGDLSSAFIEGGRDACDKISNSNTFLLN